MDGFRAMPTTSLSFGEMAAELLWSSGFFWGFLGLGFRASGLGFRVGGGGVVGNFGWAL